MVLILYRDASETAMIIKNNQAIKALHWLITTGSWINIQLVLRMMMFIITAVVCWAALKYVPSIWDWGVVVTQCTATVLGAFCIGDNINKQTRWHWERPIVCVFFHRVQFPRDNTEDWYLETFGLNTLSLLRVLAISLKDNAIVLVVIGIIYAMSKIISSVSWNIEMLYFLGGLACIALAAYLISVVFSKVKTFYQFCKEMVAINRMIKMSGAGEPWDTRTSIVKEWMTRATRLNHMEWQCSPTDQRMRLEDRINLVGKSLLTASFEIKPAGEYASRTTLSQVSKELNQLGRDLLNDKQMADAHLFLVREKHEESKKKKSADAA